MRCSSPIRIKNRSLHFLPGVHKPYIYVPCGKCESCRQLMRNAWRLRMYYHYLDFTQNRDGVVVFITLTYNDEHLNYLDLTDKNSPKVYEGWNKSFEDNDRYIKVFNKKHLDRYANSVRKRFENTYGITGLNYIFTSEYGEQKGHTFRPHYHALWYIPDFSKIAAIDGYKARTNIKKILHDMWSGYVSRVYDKHGNPKYHYHGTIKCPILKQEVEGYGFAKYSPMKKGGAFVNSLKAIDYVSKYITKDYNFFDNDNIKYCLDDELTLQVLKGHLPKHYQSQHFGSFLSDVIDCDDNPYYILLNGITLPRSKDLENHYRQPIPDYIRNSMLKDTLVVSHVDPTTTYCYYDGTIEQEGKKIIDHVYKYPNQRSLDYENYALEEKIKKQVERYIDTLSFEGLNRYFRHPDSCPNFCAAHMAYLQDYSINGVYQYIQSKIHPYSYEDLATYKYIYHDKSFNPGFSPVTIDPSSMDSLLAASRPYFRNCNYTLATYDYRNPPEDYDPVSEIPFLFSTLCSKAADFEEVLRLIDYLECDLSYHTALAYEKEFKLLRHTRSRYYEE